MGIAMTLPGWCSEERAHKPWGKSCPHCGHPLVDSVAETLPRRQRRLYEAVEQAGNAGISRAQLMEKMYYDDPNGGPDSSNIVSVTVHVINKKIAKRGLAILSRPFGVYRLMPLQTPG